ncbi:hypothetical protein [Haloferax sp. YSSS75]|uniref:hypothetical protein n=1 Tax=Haloferax sp. YSSS75 TaxID=3388564 RepID=UPI00398C9A9B
MLFREQGGVWKRKPFGYSVSQEAICPVRGSDLMERTQPKDERLWILAFGLTLVMMPAVTLVLAFAVLSATQSAIVDQLTPVELVELYVVELVAFALFGYILYRIAQYAWARQDSIEADEVPAESETSTNVETPTREGSG